MWGNIKKRVFKKSNLNSSHDLNKGTNNEIPITKSSSMNAFRVKQFLRKNPEFLDTFINEEIDVDQLNIWINQKIRSSSDLSSSLVINENKCLIHSEKCYQSKHRQHILHDLMHSIHLKPTKSHILLELASCISAVTKADGFNLYIAELDDPTILTLATGDNNLDILEPKINRMNTIIPEYVAKTRETVRLTKGDKDSQYPFMIPDKEDINQILCQAIVQPDGQLVAVLELYRKDINRPFCLEDEEISCSYLVWGGIALHYAHLFMVMGKQRKLNEFLLTVVKSIFQDMVSMDTLVIKIMNFAQKLVNADRASLFLIDSRTKELYATVFDIGSNDNEKNHIFKSSNYDENIKNEIRFPIGIGIAGQVALTGEILNIKNAYKDSRFNRSIDQITGYKTKTILCMPILIGGNIIGVMEMVNKYNGYFNKDDETAFNMFSIYCGLALHNVKLFDKIQRSEQKYRVALEVLSYHNTSTDEEVNFILNGGLPDYVNSIDDYYFNPFDYDDNEKIKFTTYMFVDLFGQKKFDINNFVRFTLTIKKNYRRVPYHNWNHGFSVANTMYTIIKKSGDILKSIESLALFIASLCHDLDHRGKNNKFMLETKSPLAAIYSTSTMEHHHFNQTVTILQQEGHNIFAKLTNSEYKNVLSLIKHCILATDLALFFPNRCNLNLIIQKKEFSWNILEHRSLVQAITMTASDLSAAAKPWDIQKETVKIIFEEFYEQGDVERKNGHIPLPMMDRNKPEMQAISQVGFIEEICLPCYMLLYQIIPETKPLLDMCQRNLNKWRDKAEKSYTQKNE